jgi:hypothetical protein
MNLSDVEDLILELKERENKCDVRIDSIDVTNDINTEYLMIKYWNKNGFKNRIEKQIDIIE